MLDPAMTPAALLAAQASGDLTAVQITQNALDEISRRDADARAKVDPILAENNCLEFLQ